jgi:heme/copper-type cytochrome/quinol oxidase subunit 4
MSLELLKRLFKYYHIELVLAVVFSIIALMYVYDFSALLSAIARKIALASIMLVYYYIVRFIKLGHIEWRDPYDKIYAITLLVCVAFIFGVG